jgi:DNA ligase-1
MKEVCKILKAIEDTTSRNGKELILENNKDNTLLKFTLFFTYNPYYIYGIGKKSLDMKNIALVKNEFFSIFDLLDYLNFNNGGSKESIQKVHSFLATVSADERNLYERIILKDLGIGITEKTINKVFGNNFVPELNIQLGSKYEEKCLKGEFIIMQKLDGSRLIAFKENNSITFMSRQGKIVDGLLGIEQCLLNLPIDNVVFDGELIAINDENLNSAELYKKTMELSKPKGIKKDLEYHIFDIIPVNEFKQGKSKETTIERKNKLFKLFKSEDYKFIKQVPMLYIGKDKEQITQLHDFAINNGWEGLMVQLCNSKYECKRVNTLLKVKKFHIADCRVTSVFEGDGKYKGMLGGIVIDFVDEDNKVWSCQCGSGFLDSERLLYWKNQDLLLNRIVEIGYFEITTNANGTKGFRFPTWKSNIRNDKDELSLY